MPLSVGTIAPESCEKGWRQRGIMYLEITRNSRTKDRTDFALAVKHVCEPSQSEQMAVTRIDCPREFPFLSIILNCYFQDSAKGERCLSQWRSG